MSPRSPQGRPVLVQAGASGTGRDVAARLAELAFTHGHLEGTVQAPSRRCYSRIEARRGWISDHEGVESSLARLRRATTDRSRHHLHLIGRATELRSTRIRRIESLTCSKVVCAVNANSASRAATSRPVPDARPAPARPPCGERATLSARHLKCLPLWFSGLNLRGSKKTPDSCHG